MVREPVQTRETTCLNLLLDLRRCEGNAPEATVDDLRWDRSAEKVRSFNSRLGKQPESQEKKEGEAESVELHLRLPSPSCPRVLHFLRQTQRAND